MPNHDLFHIEISMDLLCANAYTCKLLAAAAVAYSEKYFNDNDITSASAHRTDHHILHKLFNKKNHYLIIIFISHTWNDGKCARRMEWIHKYSELRSTRRSFFISIQLDVVGAFIALKVGTPIDVSTRWVHIHTHCTHQKNSHKTRTLYGIMVYKNTSGKNVEVVFTHSLIHSFMHALPLPPCAQAQHDIGDR